MKFISIVVMLFLLPFSVWAGTFLENFDDGDLEGWQELVVQLNEAAGSWNVINDELHAVSHKGFLRLLTTGDDTWEDYTFEFDVKPLKKHGKGAIAIAARIKGGVLFYCSFADLVIFGNDDPLLVSFLSCMRGDWHDLEFAVLYFESYPLLRVNKWSHLKLSVDGNMVAFWVNKKQVMKSTAIRNLKDVQHGGRNFKFGEFPDFLTGGVGFGLSNYTARFDNITVTGDSIPNSVGFAVTPGGKLATTWGNLKRF
jgi:hypothetical protein